MDGDRIGDGDEAYLGKTCLERANAIRILVIGNDDLGAGSIDLLVDGLAAEREQLAKDPKNRAKIDDVRRLRDLVHIKLNLEMAATEEMVAIALKHRPHAACIVPAGEGRARRAVPGLAGHGPLRALALLQQQRKVLDKKLALGCAPSGLAPVLFTPRALGPLVAQGRQPGGGEGRSGQGASGPHLVG